jgi:glucose uptake protein GlcU
MMGTEHLSLPPSGAIRACSRKVVLLTVGCLLFFAPAARAAIRTPASDSSRVASVQSGMNERAAGSSLEAAAAKAGSTGRTIAMSLIGLAFALASIALAFKRDFKEAAGVFAVGIVCVMLATPTGVSVLRDTVSSLFGSH